MSVPKINVIPVFQLAEVVHHQFMSGKTSVTREDYTVFFNAKLQWHPELDALTDSTRGKLRQVLFRMLRECGILDARREIIPVLPPRAFLDILRSGGEHEVMYFPIHSLWRGTDILYPLVTRPIAVDLDDGVKANYQKLGAALKKIPGLEGKGE